MALCVWPCNCYEKGSWGLPDLKWNLDLYARLDLADAWAIIGPVNWYSCSSNLKAMFDRLVCMNGGNPREELGRVLCQIGPQGSPLPGAVYGAVR